MSEPYYRIGFSGGEIFLSCLQDFDESDYDESRWITKRKFCTTKDAVKFMATKTSSEALFNPIREALIRFISSDPGGAWTNCLDSDTENEDQ